jgi:MgsA AAA+ ATPase C terminal
VGKIQDIWPDVWFEQLLKMLVSYKMTNIFHLCLFAKIFLAYTLECSFDGSYKDFILGLADPAALPMAIAAMQGCQLLGMPEADILLSECAVYLARLN